MDYTKLKEQWLIEENEAFQGWGFSHINGRWSHEKPKWDYKEIVCSYLKDNHKLLDMGTGGGEFLLTLNHPYNLTHVTEAYPPNAELCFKKLSSLGISVSQVFEDNYLPFKDESFDISEVNRILKPGGFFITQQVDGNSNIELSLALMPNHKN